jgi:hypothetical protein
MKSRDGLTLKVTRVGDDDGAGRLQVVQRGRHFEREISGWWWLKERKRLSEQKGDRYLSTVVAGSAYLHMHTQRSR